MRASQPPLPLRHPPAPRSPLARSAADPPLAVTVAVGVAVFVLVSVTPYWLQAQALSPFRHQTPGFPTPPDQT